MLSSQDDVCGCIDKKECKHREIGYWWCKIINNQICYLHDGHFNEYGFIRYWKNKHSHPLWMNSNAERAYEYAKNLELSDVFIKRSLFGPHVVRVKEVFDSKYYMLSGTCFVKTKVYHQWIRPRRRHKRKLKK